MSGKYERVAAIEKEFWHEANKLDDEMDDLFNHNETGRLLETLNALERIVLKFKKEVVSKESSS